MQNSFVFQNRANFMSNEKMKEASPYPRSGSAEYKLLFGNKEEEKRTLKQLKRLNKYFLIPLYRIGFLPLVGFSKVFLLLFTIGRKTGMQRVTPLEYRKKDGIIHVVAARGRKALWFKNLQANPDAVMIKAGFRKFKASFNVFKTIEEKNELLVWYVTKYPKAAKYLFGWDPKNDDPETADFTSFSELIEIVQFHPSNN